MHRLTPALLAAVTLFATLAGLTLAARIALPSAGAAVDSNEQTVQLDLFMSEEANGPKVRSFVSGTQQVYAILSYANAAGQRYRVRVRDLAGIQVKTHDSQALRGDGRVPVLITAGDFVTTYVREINQQSTAAQAGVTRNTAQCETGSIPPVPSPWPPQPQPTARPGQPTPTPINDPFKQWLEATKDAVESTRASTAALARAVQSLSVLPDVQAISAVHEGLATVGDRLAEADAMMSAVPRTLTPPDYPPNPTAGCIVINDAMTRLSEALAALGPAMAAMPADTSGWRIAPTSARYNATHQFVGCLQYEVDALEIKGNGEPADNAATSTQWTLGAPGAPALIFPGPALVDQTNAGKLAFRFAEGAGAMYAQSVNVAGVNRTATVSAYVTDAQCIPAKEATLTFAVDPAPAGNLAQTSVPLTDGIAQVVLTSGNDAATGMVNGVICVGGDCNSGGLVRASVPFSVIGPAKQLRFVLNPSEQLNPKDPKPDRRIALVSVFAKDARNQNVADGTALTVKITSGPGVLAYDRERLINGRPTGQKQRIRLEREAALVLEQGISRIAATEPGFRNGDLLLVPEGGEGKLTLVADADGTSQTQAYEIKSLTIIYLPATTKRHDIRATATRHPLPTETPGP